MHCPFCSHEETKVIDSRLAGEGTQIRRRRECLGCAERFTTFESAELVMPRVVKRDDSREPFDDHKLRSGMIRALEKRPVGSEAVEEALNSPLLDVDVTGSKGALVNIVGSADMTLEEAQKIVSRVSETLDQDAHVIWGAQVSQEMKNSVRVMVVLSGVHSPYVLGPGEKPLKAGEPIDIGLGFL